MRYITPAMIASASVALAATDTPKQPNIVLFLVDDMGWQDTSVPFGPDTTAYNRAFHTPAMERLAASGMKFTQAYACSVSSPSRCSLFTGANAARHRVTNWTYARDESTDGAGSNDSIVPPEWNINGVQRVPGIPRSYVGPSFVDELRDAGYHTIHVGKLHLGSTRTPGEYPYNWGFDVNVAGGPNGGLATYLSEKNYGHDENGRRTSRFAIEGLEKYWGSGTFVTEALTQEALKELDRARDYGTPWFLYMSHYAVHVPIDRDMRFYQSYVDRGYSPKEAAYASLVEGMDKSLGDILDWLDKTGEADNTIVIFMSDNGGLGAHGGWRDGAQHTQNAPLRSGKCSLLEGGIREPMIVRWPGRTEPGSVQPRYVMIEDFYPSIMEMAGLSADSIRPDGKRIDGISFVPLIDGTSDPSAHRPLYWNFPNHWGVEGPGINFNTAIRLDDHKLIYNYVTGEKELYDVGHDITESHNLADERKDLTDELSRRLGTYLRSVGAQRPTLRSTGKPLPWPDER
ncbi:sulfatase [Paramuribaculum intestinale]|uniref:sulfatase n=1 Tax=Paramuribaculum intestinale TaxID=2094151 RepID=UPI000FFE6408|nr:sulfatase [Muribaculaceae bacterium Isolate-004 (NCI)]